MHEDADGVFDDLSLAGLLSDGEDDSGDPAAAAAGRQFYAQVDRQRAIDAGDTAAAAARTAAAAAPTAQLAAAAPQPAPSGGGRRKRSRPQRAAGHSADPTQPVPQREPPRHGGDRAAQETLRDDERPRSRHRRGAAAANTGSALQDAVIAAQNQERANAAAHQQAARRRGQKRAEKAAAAAAEAARQKETRIVLAAARCSSDDEKHAAAPELARLSGTVPGAALQRVLAPVESDPRGGVKLYLARVRRDAPPDVPSDSGAPQVHSALDDLPPPVLTVLLSLQQAGWVYMKNQDSPPPANGIEPGGAHAVTLTAIICLTRLAFDDTAPPAPDQKEAEWQRGRRVLARQVKQLMVWARPEQFQPQRLQDTSSSEDEDEGEADAASGRRKREKARPRFDAKSLYPKLSATHQAGAGRAWPQRPDHALLRSELRHYQRAAAEWMIERETADPANAVAQSHPLWAPVSTLADASARGAVEDRKDIFYYQLSEGRLARVCPEANDGGGLPIAGGILADEMGLGKTVELLYCVLHNSKPLTQAPTTAADAAADAGAAGAVDQASAQLSSADHGKLTFVGQCDDTEQPVHLGAWWHRKNSEEDLSAAAYQSRSEGGADMSEWVLVNEVTDLGDDLDLYLDSKNTAVYSRGDASKVPVLTLATLLLDALENVRDQEQPWRVCSDVFMELPDRKKYRHYYTAIDKPIAFSNMRERVSARGYTTVEQFQEDVCLIVSNARQYNVATSAIVQDATTIEATLGQLCRRCGYCRHIPPPGQGYTRQAEASDDDSDDDDNNGEGGSEFLCEAHWGVLGAEVKSKYSRDLRNDGLHMKLCCSCCNVKHDVPLSELPDDGEDMDVVEWYCAECEADVFSPTSGPSGELIESSATLIVCPSAICQQWVNEISKHVASGQFRVHVYNGLRSGERTTAKKLAMQHIVITTYDVLRQDVYHSAAYQADGENRASRFRKKHRVVPTPLTALQWWRVCLDEAQMVETTTAKAAEMAAQLPTVHRWCVTGTPIAHGIDDLYGLLAFLRAEPLDNRAWWLNAIKKPCESLVPAALDQYHEFFCRIMWRSARVDVADQLRLPPQHQHTELLEFSDIEAYYYERQHRECLAAANDVLRKYKDLPSTEPILDKRWVQPFLRLRQACCHHQIGQASKTFLKGKSGAERPLTMAELTERLLSKAKIEAEEAQRLMLMAVNALAGLMLLDDSNSEDDNRARAMELYRETLQIAEEHSERYQFKTDDLQRIHASINLGLLVHRDDPAEATKLRESSLELRKNYSKLEHSDFVAAKLQLTAATQALTAVHPEQHFEPTVEPWWTRAASVVEQSGRAEELIDRLRRELAEMAGSSSREVTQSMLQFRDLRGLVYVLRSQLADTWTARTQMATQIRALSERMSDDDARLAGNCKECRPWGKGPSCAHCKLEKSVILGYQLRLYSLDRDARGATDGAEDTPAEPAAPAGVAGPMNPQIARLAWNTKEYSKKKTALRVSGSPAEPEIALTALLRFLSSGPTREHPDAEALRTAGQAHLKVIDMMKKEFDKLRDCWLTQREVLYRTDELLMSEMRIRICGDGEEVPKEEEHYVLTSMEEVRTRTQEFEAEKIVHMEEFQEAKSRFSYVRNLKMQQDLNMGGEEVMPCPVCHEPMAKGSDIMITPCGHMYCYFCIMKIFERFTSDRISCPMCKKQVHKEDMNHVRERKALPGNAAGGAALARAAEASGARAAAATGTGEEAGSSSSSSSSTVSAAASAPAAAAANGVSGSAAAAASGDDEPAAASASAAAAASAGSQMRPELAVKGDFGTKVDALVS